MNGARRRDFQTLDLVVSFRKGQGRHDRDVRGCLEWQWASQVVRPEVDSRSARAGIKSLVRLLDLEVEVMSLPLHIAPHVELSCSSRARVPLICAAPASDSQIEPR